MYLRTSSIETLSSWSTMCIYASDVNDAEPRLSFRKKNEPEPESKL